ncbi:hypothetical protein NLG97_g9341 [Lecanicillium saksenae]|uniref:Uncharacterized protein n=1 Tax=Lecanicillium saksenae TaxID=468837 RepID=A0ACC1QI04_9HYPO|nr:hypothetical protein NLG97_g9341 [Lecanicillium saksenae]
MYFSTTFITAISTGLGVDAISIASENKFPIQRQSYLCLHCGKHVQRWCRDTLDEFGDYHCHGDVEI